MATQSLRRGVSEMLLRVRGWYCTPTAGGEWGEGEGEGVGQLLWKRAGWYAPGNGPSPPVLIA